MFAGGWLAWPWYVLNGFALGSPNLKRECALVAGGLVGAAVLIVVLFNIAGFIVGEDRIRETVPYVILGIVVWKLVIGYWLYSLQARTFGLYEYYGGAVRSGLLVVIAGALLRGTVLNTLGNLSGFLVSILG